MASNLLKLKRSAVAGKIPATADLELGELALNTHDGYVYLKKYDGITEQIVRSVNNNDSATLTGLTLTNGTANGVAYLNGSKVLTTSTVLTFDGANLGVTGAATITNTVAGVTSALSLKNNTLGGNNRVALDFYTASTKYVTLEGGYGVLSPEFNLKVGNAPVLVMKATAGGNIAFYESTGTTAKFFWDASTERLGIGTSSPTSTLDVVGVGGGNGEISVSRVSGATLRSQAQAALGVIGTTTNHSLQFMTNNGGRMTITTAGNVGIGITAPAATLDVSKNSVGEYLRVGGDDTSNGRALRFVSSNISGGIGAFHTINAPSVHGTIAFATTSIERLRITSAGNVGIGTSAPTAKLDVNDNGFAVVNIRSIKTIGGTNNVEIGNTFQDGGIWAINAGVTGVTNDGLEIRDVTNNAIRLVVQQSGNVGIGTSSPTTKLDVAGTVTATSFAGTLITAAQPNITSVGTLSNLTVAGNLSSTTATFTNVIVTPAIGQSTTPTIVFSADAATASQDITLSVYPTSNGTLSFEGSAGQLFSITNDLTGTLFSVNDVSGIPSIEVDADGTVSLAEFSGNVGIGTSAPISKLQSYAGTGISVSHAMFGATETGRWQFNSGGNPTNRVLLQGVNSAAVETIRLDPSSNSFFLGGNVGIGTSNPTSLFMIRGGAATATISSSTNTANLDLINTTQTTRLSATNTNFNITHNSINALSITNTGNVGIGTSAPLAPLSFANTAGSVGEINKISLYDDTNNSIYGFGISANQLNYVSAVNHVWYTGATERMRIDSSGNVGIGTSTPGSKLVIRDVNPTEGIIATLQNNGQSSLTGAKLAFNQNNIANWNIGQPASTNAFVICKSLNSSNEFLRITDSGTLVFSGKNYQHIISSRIPGPLTYGLKIKTKIPAPSVSDSFNRIKIEGYDYRDANPIGLLLNFYCYNGPNIIINSTVSSFGAWDPVVHIGVENDFIVIFIEKTLSDGYYINTDISGASFAASSNHYSNWSVVDEAFVATYFITPYYVNRVGTLHVRNDLYVSDKIIHTSDTNTSIRFPANDTVSIETNNSERMRITSDGNVGIGTSSPTGKLHIDTSANSFNAITIASSFATGNSWGIGQGNGANLTIYQNGVNAERMRIDSAGNLGLGVTPSAWGNGYKALSINTNSISVAGSANAGYITTACFNNNANWIYTSSSIRPVLYTQYDSSHTWFTAPSGTAGNPITFTQAMTLDASGNLGIGTSAPVTKLHINTDSGSAAVLVNSPSASGVGSYISFRKNNSATLLIGTDSSLGGTSDDTAIYTYGANSTRFYNNGAERMRITSDGNVGVGTSAPAAKLHVIGTEILDTEGNTGSLSFHAYGALVGQIRTPYSGSAYNILAFNVITGGSTTFSNNNVERMRIDSAGNLGLGVTPSAWGGGFKSFDILTGGASFGSIGTADARVSANSYFNGTSWTYKTSSFATMHQQGSGVHRWYNAPLGTAGAAISFTQAMTLDASGRLGLGGITSPTNTLHVGGISATPSLRLGSSAAPGAYWDIGRDNAVSGDFLFLNGAAERMRITAGGNVGIGTSSPASALHVNTSANEIQRLQTSGANGGYVVFRNATINPLFIGFGTTLATGSSINDGVIRYDGSNNLLIARNGSEIARFNSDSNFGIGTTAPAAKLQVEEVGIETTTTAVTNTVQTSVFSYPTASFRTAELMCQIVDSTNSQYHSVKLFIIHDGTNTWFNETNVIHSHAELGTLTVDILSGNVRLLFTATASSTKSIKVAATMLTS